MVQKNRYDHGLNGAVAAVIRGERAMADLTIQELADRAGVNMQTLRRYLATERAFDIETLDDVARALGLSAAAVMVRAQERVAQSATQAALQPSRSEEVDEAVYGAVRGNKALGKALDRKASGDTPRPGRKTAADRQLDDETAVNKRRRRA